MPSHENPDEIQTNKENPKNHHKTGAKLARNSGAISRTIRLGASRKLGAGLGGVGGRGTLPQTQGTKRSKTKTPHFFQSLRMLYIVTHQYIIESGRQSGRHTCQIRRLIAGLLTEQMDMVYVSKSGSWPIRKLKESGVASLFYVASRIRSHLA